MTSTGQSPQKGVSFARVNQEIDDTESLQQEIDDTESLLELWSLQYEAFAFLATPCSSELALWNQNVPFSLLSSLPPRYLLLLINSCNM